MPASFSCRFYTWMSMQLILFTFATRNNESTKFELLGNPECQFSRIVGEECNSDYRTFRMARRKPLINGTDVDFVTESKILIFGSENRDRRWKNITDGLTIDQSRSINFKVRTMINNSINIWNESFRVRQEVDTNVEKCGIGRNKRIIAVDEKVEPLWESIDQSQGKLRRGTKKIAISSPGRERNDKRGSIHRSSRNFFFLPNESTWDEKTETTFELTISDVDILQIPEYLGDNFFNENQSIIKHFKSYNKRSLLSLREKFGIPNTKRYSIPDIDRRIEENFGKIKHALKIESSGGNNYSQSVSVENHEEVKRKKKDENSEQLLAEALIISNSINGREYPLTLVLSPMINDSSKNDYFSEVKIFRLDRGTEKLKTSDLEEELKELKSQSDDNAEHINFEEYKSNIAKSDKYNYLQFIRRSTDVKNKEKDNGNDTSALVDSIQIILQNPKKFFDNDKLFLGKKQQRENSVSHKRYKRKSMSSLPNENSNEIIVDHRNDVMSRGYNEKKALNENLNEMNIINHHDVEDTDLEIINREYNENNYDNLDVDSFINNKFRKRKLLSFNHDDHNIIYDDRVTKLKVSLEDKDNIHYSFDDLNVDIFITNNPRERKLLSFGNDDTICNDRETKLKDNTDHFYDYLRVDSIINNIPRRRLLSFSNDDDIYNERGSKLNRISSKDEDNIHHFYIAGDLIGYEPMTPRRRNQESLKKKKRCSKHSGCKKRHDRRNNNNTSKNPLQKIKDFFKKKFGKKSDENKFHATVKLVRINGNKNQQPVTTTMKTTMTTSNSSCNCKNGPTERDSKFTSIAIDTFEPTTEMIRTTSEVTLTTRCRCDETVITTTHQIPETRTETTTIGNRTTIPMDNHGQSDNNSQKTKDMLDILDFIKKLEKLMSNDKEPYRISNGNGSIVIRLEKIFLKSDKNKKDTSHDIDPTNNRENQKTLNESLKKRKEYDDDDETVEGYLEKPISLQEKRKKLEVVSVNGDRSSVRRKKRRRRLKRKSRRREEMNYNAFTNG